MAGCRNPKKARQSREIQQTARCLGLVAGVTAVGVCMARLADHFGCEVDRDRISEEIALRRARGDHGSRSIRKNAGSFYKSWAWQTLRFEVLQKRGRRCECCGWTPDAPGSSDGQHLQVDHIVARSKAPHLALEESNLQVLCNFCNRGKGAGEAIRFADWTPFVGVIYP